jgi:hypothetical protein
MGTVGTQEEYGRVSVLPSTSSYSAHGVIKKLEGLVAIKLFVKAGEGQRRMMAIADILDTLLEHKLLTNGTQLGTSYLSIEGLDSSNSSLYSASYFIPFTTYGE